MLFDLTDPKRRRFIKVVYATLAVLMGAGLVLFGIGSDLSGGLLDAFEGGGGGGSDTYKKQEQKLEQRVAKNPKVASSWAQLTRTRFQIANQDFVENPPPGHYTKEGLTQLKSAASAWEHYLALDPKTPDNTVAVLMAQAYDIQALNEPAKAAQAQEIVAAKLPSAGSFAALAYFYYTASQTRLGDLAAKKAISLAPKDQRSALREQLDFAKQIPTQLLQQQLQQQQGEPLPFSNQQAFSPQL